MPSSNVNGVQHGHMMQIELSDWTRTASNAHAQSNCIMQINKQIRMHVIETVIHEKQP